LRPRRLGQLLRRLLPHLTRSWLEWHPERVFDLQYGVLLADPERMIRCMLDFCGLSFDSARLAHHKTSRAVLTPGASQVRQPAP